MAKLERKSTRAKSTPALRLRSLERQRSSQNLPTCSPRQSALREPLLEDTRPDSPKQRSTLAWEVNAWEFNAEVKRACTPRVTFGFPARFLALRKLDEHVVQHVHYREATLRVMKVMTEQKITLNHVADMDTLSHCKQGGTLRAPALECMLGGEISSLDMDDICKGIGYYRFNRVSVGTMQGAPSFNLHDGQIMYFIDPRVLLKHHFIVCKGNIARSKKKDTPGRLDSTMSAGEAIMEALRAVHALEAMIAGVNKIPCCNEVAVFEGVEPEFIYPHAAVLNPKAFRRLPSIYTASLFSVTPETKRHEAGLKAIHLKRLKIACEKLTNNAAQVEEKVAKMEKKEQRTQDAANKFGFTPITGVSEIADGAVVVFDAGIPHGCLRINQDGRVDMKSGLEARAYFVIHCISPCVPSDCTQIILQSKLHLERYLSFSARDGLTCMTLAGEGEPVTEDACIFQLKDFKESAHEGYNFYLGHTDSCHSSHSNLHPSGQHFKVYLSDVDRKEQMKPQRTVDRNCIAMDTDKKQTAAANEEGKLEKRFTKSEMGQAEDPAQQLGFVQVSAVSEIIDGAVVLFDAGLPHGRLRICQDGRVDVKGQYGVWTHFVVHVMSSNVSSDCAQIALQSKPRPKRYLSCSAEEGFAYRTCTGDEKHVGEDACVFSLWNSQTCTDDGYSFELCSADACRRNLHPLGHRFKVYLKGDDLKGWLLSQAALGSGYSHKGRRAFQQTGIGLKGHEKPHSAKKAVKSYKELGGEW